MTVSRNTRKRCPLRFFSPGYTAAANRYSAFVRLFGLQAAGGTVRPAGTVAPTMALQLSSRTVAGVVRSRIRRYCAMHRPGRQGPVLYSEPRCLGLTGANTMFHRMNSPKGPIQRPAHHSICPKRSPGAPGHVAVGLVLISFTSIVPDLTSRKGLPFFMPTVP